MNLSRSALVDVSKASTLQVDVLEVLTPLVDVLKAHTPVKNLKQAMTLSSTPLLVNVPQVNYCVPVISISVLHDSTPLAKKLNNK